MTDRKPAPPEKHMAKLTIAYRDYVMPVAEATKVIQCMEKAERYMFRYRTEEQGGALHHIWSEDPLISMQMITHDTYLQGKFTGQPDDS
jgi:hypothetical protein